MVSCRNENAQSGLALIVTMVMMLAVAVLSLFAMKSIGLLERTSGNTMDKQRSLQVAESALRYGEWWLASHSSTSPTDCSTRTEADAIPKICKARLSTPQDVDSWTGMFTIEPAALSFSDKGGLAENGDIQYSRRPQLHISFLGSNPSSGDFYEISAIGYGGQSRTVSVLQSTFAFIPEYVDIEGP